MEGSGWGGWGQRECDRRIEFFGKIKKKIGGGGGRGCSGCGGVRVDVNEELKFFVKIKKKNLGWGGRGGSGWGGQGGCE